MSISAIFHTRIPLKPLGNFFPIRDLRFLLGFCVLTETTTNASFRDKIPHILLRHFLTALRFFPEVFGQYLGFFFF